MKAITFILFLSILFYDIIGQNKYFEAKNDTDKTDTNKNDSIEWISLKDREKVDDFTKIDSVIFCGEIACDVEPMKGINALTFEVLVDSKYARDKNGVYYPIQLICIDDTDCGVCYCSDYVVENADPKLFEYLGKEYATAGKNVYFRGELIEKADGESFKVIEGPEFFYFATDKNHVYKHKEIFSEADPTTFYYDERSIDKGFEHKFIIGDKGHEWQFIPPNTIKLIEKE